MLRSFRAVAFCAAVLSGLAGCVGYAEAPLVLRAVEGQQHMRVYDETFSNDRSPRFSELVLRGTIGSNSSRPDVFETGSTAVRGTLLRGPNDHYDAPAVVNELVSRHTTEAQFYQRAVCDRCL